MNLPNLSQPVQRSGNAKFASNGINPSDAKCTACCIAAGLLPWPASVAARKACELIPGCSC